MIPPTIMWLIAVIYHVTCKYNVIYVLPYALTMLYDFIYFEQFLAFLLMQYVSRTDLMIGVVISFLPSLMACYFIALYKSKVQSLRAYPNSNNDISNILTTLISTHHHTDVSNYGIAILMLKNKSAKVEEIYKEIQQDHKIFDENNMLIQRYICNLFYSKELLDYSTYTACHDSSRKSNLLVGSVGGAQVKVDCLINLAYIVFNFYGNIFYALELLQRAMAKKVSFQHQIKINFILLQINNTISHQLLYLQTKSYEQISYHSLIKHQSQTADLLAQLKESKESYSVLWRTLSNSNVSKQLNRHQQYHTTIQN